MYHTRKAGNNDQWYKKSMGGKCPNKSHTITESYWKTFGCQKDMQKDECEKLAENAKICASERMADMKHLIDNGIAIDKNHVYPIMYAYSLGYNCLEISGLTGVLNEYKANFRKWYDELTDNRQNIAVHSLFTDIIGISDYPLELYSAEQNNRMITIRSTMPKQPKKNKIIENTSNWGNTSVDVQHIKLQNNQNNAKSTTSKNSNNYLKQFLKGVSRKGGKRHMKTRKNRR